MKKIIILGVSISLVCSCTKVSDQPPVNEGYDSGFVLPEAEMMSVEDRAIVTAIEEEYDANADKD